MLAALHFNYKDANVSYYGLTYHTSPPIGSFEEAVNGQETQGGVYQDTPIVGLLRIDYCDERLVYQNGYISRTKVGTCTYYTSNKIPDFSLSNHETYSSIRHYLEEKLI